MKLHCSSLFLFCCLTACSSDEEPDPSGTGGSGTGGDSQGTGASPSTGGTSTGGAVATGGTAATGGAGTGGDAMGGMGGMGGDPSSDFACTDENSVLAEANAWTNIPDLAGETAPCVKIVVPDYLYATLNVKIQNNEVNVDGTVSISGNGYAKDFGSLAPTNAQLAILDLERGNSVEAPHASPYYVKVEGGLSGQQVAWEIVY